MEGRKVIDCYSDQNGVVLPEVLLRYVVAGPLLGTDRRESGRDKDSTTFLSLRYSLRLGKLESGAKSMICKQEKPPNTRVALSNAGVTGPDWPKVEAMGVFL